MENIKSFFDSFKEFVWDIIGYLLPGSYLIILLSTLIDEHFYYTSSLANAEKGLFVFIFILISYILGYVVYGIGIYKEDIFKENSYKSLIEKKLSTEKIFLSCREVYNTNNLAKESDSSKNELNV